MSYVKSALAVGSSVVLQRLLSLLICTPLFSREVWAGARKSRWADGYNAVGGSHGSCARLMLARRPAVSFAHKEKLSYEQRCYESTRVREKYSDRFPVIVERDSNSDVPAIDKCAQTPRMQDATHTLTIRCMHILHTRAGNTLRTPARCYPQAIHAYPLTHPQVQVPDPARHDDGPAGVRAAQADLRARGAGDLRVRRKHATTRERAGQQRGVLPHLSPV